MNKKEISKEIVRHFHKIERLAHKCVVHFDTASMDEFRVEVKRLRAFLRLIQVLPDGENNLRISGHLKSFYGYTGIIDNISRHLGFIKQTCTAYLDEHLRSDPAAKQWLAAKQIEKVSKGECELRAR